MLVDEAKIYIRSGDGGKGIVAFRREKYIPHGGPSGGDGGKGGDVILRVNPRLNTLFYFKRNSHFKAERGRDGGSSNKTGAGGEDRIIEVPPGTIVRDADTDKVIADLVKPDDEICVAIGGRGGKGNSRFKSASNRAPRVAEKGAPGKERWLKLELRLLADIGLVGVPNAGKSTLLSVVSNAKPRIADYPFTTLEPNLGVVVYDHQDLVFADIPGLIEGAHMGVGLGHAFLRHVQRCRVLIHLLDGAGEDPLADYNQINAELALFDPDLAEKPQIVVLNKIDLPRAQEREESLKTELESRGVKLLTISAVTQTRIQDLIQRVFEEIARLPDETAIDADDDVDEAMPVYELTEDVPIFEVSRAADGTYVVTGERVERAASMTYWDYDEAILRFQKILEVLGVTDALREAGVEPGDTVFIGEFELEWTD